MMTPNGSNTKTTQLEVVNYEHLAARDTKEIQKLVSAATGRGIFFVDFRGPAAKSVLADLKPILNAQRKFFAQPLEIKNSYSSELPERGILNRYEKFDHGNAETLLLSREEELDGTLNIPDDLQPVAAKLKNVSSFSDAALRDLVSILSTSLEPPVPTSVVDDPSKPGKKTNLTLGLASAPAGTDLIPSHADSGIITLLYYDIPTLEILEPTTGDWELVQPIDGLHVVYVGQELQKLSQGRLNAALHRVKQPEGSTALVVYLLHGGVK